MSRKIADQLVDTLHEAGIKRVYGVTGDSLNPVNDAVRRHKNIDWIHVHHEETGAFAAAAEAQLNGIACCAGSCGPGHVHLVNGVYDAHRSNAPMLVIASSILSSEVGTKYFQETDPLRLFADCSGYNQMANTPDQFPRMLHGALQYAVHRQEVSVLGLPGDVASQKAVESKGTTKMLRTRSVSRPETEEIQAGVKIIEESRNITLFCGIGCKEAHNEVVALAEKLKAPVAYTFKSKMIVQYDNPYEIGMTGLLGLPAAYQAMQESDLILMLGTDFPYTPFIPVDCKIMQVDVRPERIGRRAKVDMGLAGDVKHTISAILPLIKERKSDRFLKKHLARYAKHDRIMKEVAQKAGRKDAIAPEYAAALIDRYAPADAIFTVDTGMCCVCGARYLTATADREMLGSFNHGSMANALPQAIEASLARPQQPVVALCGDGGISMLLGELATVVQYRLPIKLFVFNNRALGMVKLEMEVAGIPDWQTDMYNPDFAAVARAMGIKSTTVHRPQDVEDSIKKAMSTPGPVLVELMTDPEALALPPHIEFSQVRGFAEAMAKVIAGGNFSEIWNTIRSNAKHVKEFL